MKHLRLLNILIVMLLLVAWAPAPQTPDISAAAVAAPVLVSPASGALIDGYQPDFKWKTPAYTVDSYTIMFTFDPYFKNAAKQIAVINAIPSALVDGVETYNPDFDLPSNSRIYWRVQAVSAGTPSSWSAGRYIKTKPRTAGAAVDPTGGETVSSLRPLFDWADTPDPDAVLRSNKFDIQIRLMNGAVVKTATIVGTQYQYPSDLKRNTHYEWHIRAKGVYFAEPYSPWVEFVTPNPPGIPVLSAPVSGYILPSGTDPEFKWSTSVSPNGLVVTYILELSTSSKFASIYKHYEPTASPFTPPDDLDTGTYYWRVRAVDSAGAMSNWSAVRSVKTQPSLKVTVRDFLTKAPIPGATVTITKVTDPQTSTDLGVVYIPEIVAGSKSIKVVKDDYVTKTVSTSTPAGVAREVVVELVHTPMKVVLTWKGTANLDLHYWIPVEQVVLGDEVSEITGHVNPDHRATTTAKPYARLSADIVKGGSTGETILIQNRYPGDSYIAVFNFTYKSSLLTSSQAVVKIYKGNMSVPIYTREVPTVGEGKWWLVGIIKTDGSVDFGQSNLRKDSPGLYDKLGGTFGSAIPEE